ncbi:hypothetical protein SMICM304S_08257 [Streptomyces microflavus]
MDTSFERGRRAGERPGRLHALRASPSAQLLGPSRSEERLIALAAQLEDDLRWHDHRPPSP